ncbi:MAG TPA: N-acetyltransferase [Kofleriaceae bacterium]
MFRPRPARREDHADYVRFVGQLGTEQAPFEIDWWDEHYRRYTTFLETPIGELVAYALIVPLGSRGDVRQIAVDPTWRGRGIGKRLMEVVRAQLREAGCRDWHLEVRSENETAIALYRSVGMTVLHEIDVMRLSREGAERFAATRSGALRVEPVDLTQDVALEQRFDLGSGQLQRWRSARPNAVMWHIGGVALTHYMPGFLHDCGLLFPFRAPDADHAAHLIAEACSFGMPKLVELCAIERPVATALRAVGAQVYDHEIEMGGPL